MAITIAICNHKGGVGKTTTAANLAYTLANFEKQRILVIDMDPQGNATSVIGGKSPYDYEKTVFHLLTDKKENFSSLAVPSQYKNIDLIPCNIEAAELSTALGNNDLRRFNGLQIRFDAEAREKYDFAIVDCPPSIESLFFTNSIIISDYIVVPVESQSNFSLYGVKTLLNTINELSNAAQIDVKLLGALITMHDSRCIMDKQMATAILSFFGTDHVFRTRITRSTAIGRANSSLKAICDIEPNAAAAKTYKELAKETLERVAQFKANAA